MRLRSYWRCVWSTTLNIIWYALSNGGYLHLEGRVRSGWFLNWARNFGYRPKKFAQPTSEAEIIDLIRSSERVRVFGSAHSFNSGIQTDGTLISLDKYAGVISVDRQKMQMRVKGGTRVRDVVAALLEHGLAFEALPSHDAQSIAGIISTDVHGTGTRWGFVSQSVLALKLIDGHGDVHECTPDDDLFKAAIGGVGAVGIISEVLLQAVPRFNAAQKFWVSTIDWVEANFDQLLQDYDHVSLYLFPFTRSCQVNTWTRTTVRKSFLCGTREFIDISLDALVAAWFGNWIAYGRSLPGISRFMYVFKRGTNLVMESNAAFNRSIYHAHQELEFTVPFEDTFAECRRFLRLYEDLYPQGLPYMLFEVRFTPARHNRSLLSAGRDQHSCWIDLVTNDSDGYEIYYEAAESVLREIDARPHLGKYCKQWNKADLQRLHGEAFTRFLELRDKHDPSRKFLNPFTERLFGR